jgi:hypothetical protein
MTPPTLREIGRNLHGAWRFTRFDRSAMLYFDSSIDAVWRSFWAAALAYPGTILLIVLRLDAEQRHGTTLLHILLLETMGYIILWAAFPLIILGFCRWLKREEEALDFIIAYNWWQVLQTGIYLAVTLIDLALPPGARIFALVGAVFLLACEWYIARTVLAAGGMVAFAVMLLDLVLSAAMAQLTESLY